jgi:hypothetical protein
MGERGVLTHDRKRAWQGYTLYSESWEDPKASPDGKGEILLIDMDGEIVHRWYVETALQSFAQLLPDGNLIYPTRDRSDIMKAGLRELDPQSNVVWSYHCRIDHDFAVFDDGRVLMHTIRDHMWPQLGTELKRCPYMVEVNRDRELLWEWHGEHHLEELRDLLPEDGWEHVAKRIREEFSFDWAHNNTLQIIPPNATWETERELDGSTRFRPGNIVFSYRSLDVIGVIDRRSSEIVWAWGPGVIDGQHKPHMLPSGNIMLFDNGTLRGFSRVIEVNPLTEEIVWEYRSQDPGEFFSPYISGGQRLPNGNTLICEGNKAHLFEVSHDGEIVWDFVNPHRKPGALGSIYRCERYPESYCKALLDPI